MIDTHAHIDFKDFDDDREQVIRDALDCGVRTIINIGIDADSSLRSVELADRNEAIYATVGYHPHDSKAYNRENREKIERLAQHPKVVAIGEIGLDFYRDYSPREVQERTFREQLAMAREFELPVVIHIRKAMEDAFRILHEEKVHTIGGVLHCFPGDLEDARRAADMGLMISFGGSLTFKNSRTAPVAVDVPLDMIILETDCPFITPVPYRGKRNQPAYVRYAYEKLAELKGELPEKLEKTVDDNAGRLFNLTNGRI